MLRLEAGGKAKVAFRLQSIAMQDKNAGKTVHVMMHLLEPQHRGKPGDNLEVHLGFFDPAIDNMFAPAVEVLCPTTGVLYVPRGMYIKNLRVITRHVSMI